MHAWQTAQECIQGAYLNEWRDAIWTLVRHTYVVCICSFEIWTDEWTLIYLSIDSMMQMWYLTISFKMLPTECNSCITEFFHGTIVLSSPFNSKRVCWNLWIKIGQKCRGDDCHVLFNHQKYSKYTNVHSKIFLQILAVTECIYPVHSISWKKLPFIAKISISVSGFIKVRIAVPLWVFPCIYCFQEQQYKCHPLWI